MLLVLRGRLRLPPTVTTSPFCLLACADKFSDFADPLRAIPGLDSDDDFDRPVRRRSFFSLPTAAERARKDVLEMLLTTLRKGGVDDWPLPNFSWKSLQFSESSLDENIVLVLVVDGSIFLLLKLLWLTKLCEECELGEYCLPSFRWT